MKISILSKFFQWIKKNPAEAILLTIILAVGAFLRLYKIDQYMTFLGDEGRDVIIVRRLLVYGDPILIGPGTSIGNMYLGPLYYYMMAPALFLANFSPAGPAILVAILGVLTIFFIWLVGREWFPVKAIGDVQGTSLHTLRIGGLIAAFLYAISPTVIVYSRSSWNPNIMPFFSLLSIYSIWKVYESRGALRSESGSKTSRKVGWWLIILGISFAFVLQSHYLGLLLAPTLVIFWFLALAKVKGEREIVGKFVKNSLIGLGLFLFLMSPLLIFDARHSWRNFDAMKKFFAERQTTVSAKPWTAVPKIPSQFIKINTRLLTARNEAVGLVTTIVIIIAILWLITTSLRSDVVKHKNAYLLLFSWFGFALLGLGLYKQEIYDHYYGFFFAAPFLLLGALTENMISGAKGKRKNIRYLVSSIIVGTLVFINLKNSPIRFSPNMQMQRSISVAKVIQEKANGERFNLATISERNNRDVYQYFLQMWGAKIVDTDPSATTYTLTDQLFVVCEIPREKCDPVHDPSAWITSFGWTKIVAEWPVWGGTLFKLGHTK